MAHAGVYARNRRDLGDEGMVGSKGKDRVLTVMQVKDRLNCSRSHVQNLISAGKLKSFLIGEKRGIRVYESEVERFKTAQVEKIEGIDE